MLLQKTSVSLSARSLPARRPPRCSAARRLVPCTRLHRCRAAANDASAGNGAGVLGVSSLPLPQAQAPSEPPSAEQMAAAQYAVLSQFSQVHWTEVLAGVLYLLFMSETLRFCVEVTTASLPSRLLAGSLVALLFDFSQMAYLQLRGSRTAAAAGRPVLRFRLLLAFKIAAEIAGAALVALKCRGAEGAALALGGHFVFNVLNDVIVSGNGDVKPFPPQARKPLIVTDALLTGLCVVCTCTDGLPALVCASVFTAFSSVYLFFKFVLKRKI